MYSIKDDGERSIVEKAFYLTNPIKPYEARIISGVIGISKGVHLWRFQRGQFCSACRRELSVIDYFLTAIQWHTPGFIAAQVCPEHPLAGECTDDPDVTRIDALEAVAGGVSITCTNCGNDNVYATYKLYVHPGCKGFRIRGAPAIIDALRSEG